MMPNMPPPISGAGTAAKVIPAMPPPILEAGTTAKATASPTTATVRSIADVNSLNIWFFHDWWLGRRIGCRTQRALTLADFVLILSGRKARFSKFWLGVIEKAHTCLRIYRLCDPAGALLSQNLWPMKADHRRCRS